MSSTPFMDRSLSVGKSRLGRVARLQAALKRRGTLSGQLLQQRVKVLLRLAGDIEAKPTNLGISAMTRHVHSKKCLHFLHVKEVIEVQKLSLRKLGHAFHLLALVPEVVCAV